jgi:histidine triad (HIT) family protein
MDCLFCEIAKGREPAKIIYQDKYIVAFDDIYPKAPQHKLIIPRKHLTTFNDLTPEDNELISHMFLMAKKIASDIGISQSGYRISINCNADGGQVIYHLHLHLLGGKKLGW